MVISTYCANVRSALEYGCVIWDGAANTHMKRTENVQHKFLMLARCRVRNVSLDYKSLLGHFGVASLAARRLQYDIRLLRDIHNTKIDSPFLLQSFPLAAPSRVLRNRVLFHVPHARVNTVKGSMFVRIPRHCNEFLNSARDVDIWHTGSVFLGSVSLCTRPPYSSHCSISLSHGFYVTVVCVLGCSTFYTFFEMLSRHPLTRCVFGR